MMHTHTPSTGRCLWSHTHTYDIQDYCEFDLIPQLNESITELLELVILLNDDL